MHTHTHTHTAYMHAHTHVHTHSHACAYSHTHTHQPPQLTKKEIEDLLKKGAYGALMEEDDDANK